MSSSSVAGIWPWGDGDFQFRHVGFEKIVDFREVGQTRADVKTLAATIMLAHQRFADYQGIKRRNEGAHSHTIDRCSRDQRQLADAGQRQLQRARDRGR